MASSTKTEIAIIGGGIIGCAIAYYLGKSGLDAVLLERGEIAGGTSSRCDGNILAIDKDPGFDSRMSLVSQQIIGELSHELKYPFEYRAPGSILVCENDKEMEAVQIWVNRQKEAGLPFRMLDKEDIRQESRFFADDLPGGLECASDSTVNPYLLTYALAEEAENFGVKIQTGTNVTLLKRDQAAGTYTVSTNKGDICAKKVVNAAGVWAPGIGEMVGVHIPILPRKGHIVVASRQQPVGLRKVMEFGYLMSKFGGSGNIDPVTGQYGVALVFEPTESQNFLIGSSRQFTGFDTTVDMEVIRCIAARVIRFYPKISDFNVIRTYAGLRPWTRDHLPIVSPVEQLPGFYIAAGHEGDGISLAAVTGKLMAEMIDGQSPTVIPAEPLSIDRFKKNASEAQHKV